MNNETQTSICSICTDGLADTYLQCCDNFTCKECYNKAGSCAFCREVYDKEKDDQRKLELIDNEFDDEEPIQQQMTIRLDLINLPFPVGQIEMRDSTKDVFKIYLDNFVDGIVKKKISLHHRFGCIMSFNIGTKKSPIKIHGPKGQQMAHDYLFKKMSMKDINSLVDDKFICYESIKRRRGNLSFINTEKLIWSIATAEKHINSIDMAIIDFSSDKEYSDFIINQLILLKRLFIKFCYYK